MREDFSLDFVFQMIFDDENEEKKTRRYPISFVSDFVNIRSIVDGHLDLTKTTKTFGEKQMQKIFNEFVWIFCLWICPTSWSLLTGTHLLTTVNCSPSTLYIPQGPYLFSHHWPFTSISVHYDGQTTLGTCYRDGSLYFSLRNDQTCSGLYYAGHAKLLCRFDGEDFCIINMKTMDGSPLTCSVSKIQMNFIGLTFISLFFVLFIC